MPEHTVKYNLPEEQDDLLLAMHGADWYGVVWELTEHFLKRKIRKGAHNFKTPSEALEAVWEEIFRLMEVHGVNLDMVS